MARHRRSRSLRDELAEAEKLADMGNIELADQEEESDNKDRKRVQAASVSQIRPNLKSVKPQGTPRNEEHIETPVKSRLFKVRIRNSGNPRR